MFGNQPPPLNLYQTRSGGGGEDSSVKGDVRQLQERVDKLELICEALWSLLKEQGNLEDIYLIEKITEIDLRDGRLDGKKTTVTFKDCPKCQRRVKKSHKTCIYCGNVFLDDPFA